MLLLLMVIWSIVCIVVLLMLFVLLKAFAILFECQLVVVQFFAVFFLLAMCGAATTGKHGQWSKPF